MKILIVGKGNVGEGIGYFISKNKIHIIEYIDPFKEIYPSKEFKPEIIHICFVFDNSFYEDLLNIINKYRSDLKFIIIESTVPPLLITSIEESININKTQKPIFVFHSPIRGSSPDIIDGLKNHKKYICIVKNQLEKMPIDDEIILTNYFHSWLPLDTMSYITNVSAESIAAGKILSVNWYGMEIAYSQMVKRYCEKNDLDFDIVYKEFMRTTKVGREYEMVNDRAISKENIERPICYPGEIKGHCVMDNIDIALNYDIGDKMLWEWIKKNNDWIKYKDM